MATHIVTMWMITTWLLSSLCVAQSPRAPISTSMPVPPLQWLNLKGLTQGSPPPPLKDATLGYDESTRSLILFGGESPAGVPQQSTYLLNMDTLTWSTPLSKVGTQMLSPPARSRALGTGDFAANSRRDFLIYGGKGAGNSALGDVWAFDYLNQFWVNLTLSGSPPKPRWGTVGGIDAAVVPTSGNNVNSTFYIAGGSDSQHSFPSSDLWQLVITGTLASDVTAVEGQWQDKSLASELAGKTEAGGALISKNQATGARIVISGGCTSNTSPLNANSSCTDSSTYVLSVSGSFISPTQCPAPRLGPVIVPNLNPSATSFVSQSFMLLGTFDSSQWNDNGGLNKGEVAVLDADAGTWARILPSGDPGLTGTPTFPSPREGSAALSFPSALVGDNRQASSDTIIFGGRDTQGAYLNDLWILRAYNGSLTQSGESWSGFGNGRPDRGASASGAGVSVQYLTQCAQQLKPNITQSSTTSNTAQATNKPAQTHGPVSTPVLAFDTSIVHKLLSPVSIALTLAATVIARLSSPATNVNHGSSDRRVALVYIAIPAGLAAYGLGVAGFAMALTSTILSSDLQRRNDTSADTSVRTVHGQAGLALFVGLYGLVPLFALCLWWGRRKPKVLETRADDEVHQKESEETGAITGEKRFSSGLRAVSPTHSVPDINSTNSSGRVRRQRAQSGPGLFPGWRGKDAGDSPEAGPVTPTKGFEVVNRPRRVSGGTTLYPRDYSHRSGAGMVRSLSDISWLERRRSVGAVSELDYALNQLPASASPRSVSPPPTSRPPTVTMSNRHFVRTPTPTPTPDLRLDSWDIVLHTLFHTFLLANCVLSLVILFSRAPLATFIAFFAWTLAFYFSLLLLAWNGRPQRSILVTALTRLRTPPKVAPPGYLGSPVDEHVGSASFHTPTPSGSPYIFHQPPWQRAISPEASEDLATRTSHGGLHTVEADDPGDNEDEDDRLEEELQRRDVNLIVTVPRRRLWIANPS